MEKIIHMPSIAFHLRKRGSPILRTDINIKKPQYEVYFFEDTPAFEQALSEVLEERRQYKVNKRL